MLYPIFAFLCCLCHVYSQENTTTTVKLRLNLPAFQFFSSFGHHVIDEEIPKISLPPVRIPITGGPGSGNVSVQNMRISKFKSPLFHFNLTNKGILWHSTGGAVKINGDWTAEYQTVLPLSESGWLEVVASDVVMTLDASAFVTDGKPQIKIGDCDVLIKHFQIRIGGGVLPWLINLFRADISIILKNLIHEQACSTARTVFVKEANEFLKSLPTHISLGNNFYLDYVLNRKPKSTALFVEAEGLANVVLGKTTCSLSEIHSWKDGGSPSMAVVWVSESVPNCLFSSAHEAKIVHFPVTKNLPQLESYLRTSCGYFSFCIGRFFPELSRLHPNEHVDLVFSTFKAPKLSLKKSEEARLNISFAVDFHLNPYTKHPQPMARLILESVSSVEPYIDGHSLVAALNETETEARQDFSHIGDMSERFLSMFNRILGLTGRVLIQSLLHKGMPLPIFDNITIANSTEINIMEGFVRLNIDFAYE